MNQSDIGDKIVMMMMFKKALGLCVEIKFAHWNHAYLVLLAYRQCTGFV
ncbi:20449_t:CDS:2 [Cetraspora pellucida]|uniref:20449_t:CDS:1 n=1 Tax=Cetraspora pellucida TaxID=1433469 RepID=A0A9N9EPR3_9GLOM|nr:20449_t:CDS:2 [Cetraspora pellucida]